MIEGIKAVSKDYMRINIRPKVYRGEAPEVIIISIINPGDARVYEEDTDRIITMFFDDCTPLTVLNDFFNVGMRFCSTEDAVRMNEFLRKWHESEERVMLYINCSAGINRSGSVAKFAQAQYSDIPFQHFAYVNPQIKGNDWVYMKLIEAYLNGK